MKMVYAPAVAILFCPNEISGYVSGNTSTNLVQITENDSNSI